jgi:DNA-binding phage protein
MAVEATIWDVVDNMKTRATERGYLETALEDRDPALVALAFRDASRSHGLHELADLCDEQMTVATLLELTDSLGYQLTITPKPRRN